MANAIVAVRINAPFFAFPGIHNIKYPIISTAAMILANSKPFDLSHRNLYGILNVDNKLFAHGVHACSHHARTSAVLAVGVQFPLFPIATGHKGPSQPMTGSPSLHAAARK
jgi:hypothetical protein